VNHLALAAALTAVLVVLALGFRYLGSPANQRAINSDERRLEDLRSIAQWIHARSLALPATLSEPAQRSHANLTDPVTHAPYEYRAKSGKDYELSAAVGFGTIPRGAIAVNWMLASRSFTDPIAIPLRPRSAWHRPGNCRH
jgi:hypothetical protein